MFAAPPPPSWPLVGIGTLGWVSWRGCERGRHGLSYRARPSKATEVVTLRVGGRAVVVKTLQPGQSVRFPFESSRRQEVVIDQVIEPGRLVAHVTVDFAPGSVTDYCRPYDPPGVTVQMKPRH